MTSRPIGLLSVGISAIARAVRRDIGYLALDMNRGRIHSCQETINRHPAIHLYVRTL